MKILSVKDKNRLLKEFKTLTSVADKFKFWEEKLNQKYIYVLSLHNPYKTFEPSQEEKNWDMDIQEFWIMPSQEQALEWNTIVLNEYTETFERLKPKKSIWNLNDMISKFDKEYINLKNKKEYIQHEIERINDILQEKKSMNKVKIQNVYTVDSREMRGYWFEYGYKRQMFEDGEVEIENLVFDFPHLIEALNGVTLGKYRKFIEQIGQPQKKTKEHEITVSDQILLLEFLGVFEKINEHKTAAKKANFLASLLNRNSQSIREIYSQGIHKITSQKERKNIKDIEKSLNRILELFESIDLVDEAKKVKIEIDLL